MRIGCLFLDHQLVLKQRVYAMVTGPVFEINAQLRLLRIARADAVGMSTVHEMMRLRLGFNVARMSLITNRKIPGESAALSHA